MTYTDEATRQDYEALAAGALVAGALLLEHVTLWPCLRHVSLHDELAPLFPYIVGTATLGVGLTALASVRPLRWTDFWLVAGPGGATVAAARLWRWWLSHERLLYEDKGRIIGHVAGGRWGLDEADARSRAGAERY